MGAFNGGALLIVVALVAFLVFRREIAAWVDAAPVGKPCELCGGMTPAKRPTEPVVCARCAPVTKAGAR